MGFLTTAGMISSRILEGDYAEANDLLAMVEASELVPTVDYILSVCYDMFTLEDAYLMYEMAAQINPLVRSTVMPKWSMFLKNNLYDDVALEEEERQFPGLMEKRDFFFTIDEELWLNDKALNLIYIKYRYMPRMHLIYKVMPPLDQRMFELAFSMDIPFFTRIFDMVMQRYEELTPPQFYHYIKNLQYGIVQATTIDIVDLMNDVGISNEYIESISIKDEVNLLWLDDVLHAVEDEVNKLRPLSEHEQVLSSKQRQALIDQGFNEDDITGLTYEVPDILIRRLRRVFLHNIVYGLYQKAGIL